MIKEIQAKVLLSHVKQPDTWFGLKYNMNLYRGCQHRCAWCQYELERAFKRWQNNEVTIFPYLFKETKLPDLIRGHVQPVSTHDLGTEGIFRLICRHSWRIPQIGEEKGVDAPTNSQFSRLCQLHLQ